MKQKKYRVLLVFAIVLMMLLNTAPLQMGVQADGEDEGDRTDDLKGLLEVTLLQGKPPIKIEEDGTIDGTQDLTIIFTLGVPVEGDGLTPDDAIHKGDFAEFPISPSFSVLESAPIELFFGEGEDKIKVGTASFVTKEGTTYARVDFDGEDEVFEFPDVGSAYSGVEVTFEATLSYGGHQGDDPWGEQDVKILEKTYTVNIDTEAIEYNVTKKAAELTADRKIEWTVTVEATKTVTVDNTEHTKHIDLKGYTFQDDLTSIGAYVPESFMVGSKQKTPTNVDNVLSYTFDEEAISPQTITFKTKLEITSILKTAQPH